MDHLEYAIYRMAHDFEGGVTALAQRINVRPGTLIAKVDPANDAATTNVRELVAMLLTTGDIRPLAEIARACGYVLTPAAARDDGAALLDATLDAGAAHCGTCRTSTATRSGASSTCASRPGRSRGLGRSRHSRASSERGARVGRLRRGKRNDLRRFDLRGRRLRGDRDHGRSVLAGDGRDGCENGAGHRR